MRGRLLARRKRFLARIETETGGEITAYCPATGRLTSCLRVGAPVEYFRVESEDRKLNYDWWSIRMTSGWVVIDTRPANRILRRHRGASWMPPAWNEATWEAEPALESGGRLDFSLPAGDPTTWIEVKSVTWAHNRTGFFPDAPTERGRRHLRHLMELADSGHAAYLVFVCMRPDVEAVKPASWVDPDFASLMQRARKRGVNIIGVQSRVDHRTVRLLGRIPVRTNTTRTPRFGNR